MLYRSVTGLLVLSTLLIGSSVSSHEVKGPKFEWNPLYKKHFVQGRYYNSVRDFAIIITDKLGVEKFKMTFTTPCEVPAPTELKISFEKTLGTPIGGIQNLTVEDKSVFGIGMEIVRLGTEDSPKNHIEIYSFDHVESANQQTMKTKLSVVEFLDDTLFKGYGADLELHLRCNGCLVWDVDSGLMHPFMENDTVNMVRIVADTATKPATEQATAPVTVV